jgi:hypothetical protein
VKERTEGKEGRRKEGGRKEGREGFCSFLVGIINY